MITISTWALVAILIIGTLSFDAIGSGILYFIHHMRQRGAWWLSGGLTGATLFLALLSRYARVHPVLIFVPMVIGLLCAANACIAEYRYRRRIDPCKITEQNKVWIEYIKAFFKYCGLDEVEFREESYSNGSRKPWCRRWNKFIKSMRLSQNNPNAIVLTVEDNKGRTIESQFDENSNEDFKFLFFEAYNKTNKLNIFPDLEEWMERYASARVLREKIIAYMDAKSVSYDMKTDTLEVIVPEWGDITGITSALYHIFEDQGYYKEQFNTKSGTFNGAGMFNQEDEVHPDIRNEINLIPIMPYWLEKILDECDNVDFTPAYINFIVDSQ